MLGLILLVFSFVCFVIAAFSVPTGRFNLVAAGLAFFIANLLFAGAGHLMH